MTSYLIAILACLSASGASADDFADRCKELSRKVKISAVFHDLPIAIDESRNIEELKGMSGKPAGSRHNVYGLTLAEPYIRLVVVPQAIVDGHGNICAVPHISVNLGFSEMVVYIARELTDRCHRSIIREHEGEHVNTWKTHLRASAQLMKTTLLQVVGEPRTYTSRDDLEAGIRSWSEALVAPLAKRIIASAIDAQRAIDSPASYASVASRLRGCPQRAL